MKTKIKTLLLSIILATQILLLPLNTKAIGLVTITVKDPNPVTGNYSWFVYEKNKGDTIKDTATIRNLDKKPVKVKIYAVDATSNQSGSFILTFPKEQQKTIGTWTKLNQKELTLNPLETKNIPFEINIPKNATPGQYQGGIIIETSGETPTNKNTEKTDTKNGVVAVSTRIGTRIYLTIKGKIHNDISLKSFKASKNILTGKTQFKFTIQNKGNMTIEPKAHIEIYDSFGNLYETINETLGTSSPQTTIKPTITMKKHPLMGSFTAKLTMSYNAKFTPSNMHESPEIETKEIQFWIMPWEIICSICLLFLLITTFTGIKIYNKKTYIKNSEQYKFKKHDNIMQIAKDRNINWKQLAKHNKIKAPYIIKEGTTILVPKKK